jgi:hypothetical protein
MKPSSGTPPVQVTPLATRTRRADALAGTAHYDLDAPDVSGRRTASHTRTRRALAPPLI